MVISMEPMITIPDGQPGAGGYREHDILIITEDGNENITKYPYGPAFNVVGRIKHVHAGARSSDAKALRRKACLQAKARLSDHISLFAANLCRTF